MKHADAARATAELIEAGRRAPREARCVGSGSRSAGCARRRTSRPRPPPVPMRSVSCSTSPRRATWRSPMRDACRPRCPPASRASRCSCIRRRRELDARHRCLATRLGADRCRRSRAPDAACRATRAARAAQRRRTKTGSEPILPEPLRAKFGSEPNSGRCSRAAAAGGANGPTGRRRAHSPLVASWCWPVVSTPPMSRRPSATVRPFGVDVSSGVETRARREGSGADPRIHRLRARDAGQALTA